jgi:predicted  nucleic acid-binding Zn-ribbon protein
MCLTLPLLSLLLTQACVDDQARSDKKKLQKQLAEQERQSADLLKEKAAMEAQKSQLELEAAQDAQTIEANNKKIEDLNQKADANASEINDLKKANADLQEQVKAKAAEAAALQKEIDSLEEQLKERDDAIKARTEEINRLTKDLTAANTRAEDLTKQVSEQKATITAQEQKLAEKTAALAKLEAENALLAGNSAEALDALRAEVAALQKLVDEQNGTITAHEKALAEKTEALAKLEAENALLAGDASEALNTLRAEVATLQKDLEAAKAQEETLSTQLTAEQERSAALSARIKDLDATLREMKAQTSAVQVFLANAGQDSLFVLEPDMVRDTYTTAEGESCTIIFNINRTIDVVRGPARADIPGLTDRTMLPLKGGYQKVVVCQKGEDIRAQVENGSIYQSVPNNNNAAIQLVSARESSSCGDNENKSLFASKFQLFYPYRGHIDGIETIDLMRANNEMLRYNMASSTNDFLGTSCTEIVNDGIATELSVLACRLALGQETDATVTKGCFKEVMNNGKTELSFQAQ